MSLNTGDLFWCIFAIRVVFLTFDLDFSVPVWIQIYLVLSPGKGERGWLLFSVQRLPNHVNSLNHPIAFWRAKSGKLLWEISSLP